jgi:hypothetical protein
MTPIMSESMLTINSVQQAIRHFDRPATLDHHINLT